MSKKIDFKIIGKQILIETPAGRKKIKQARVLKASRKCKYVKNDDIVYFEKQYVNAVNIKNTTYHILKEEDIIGRRQRPKLKHRKMIIFTFAFSFFLLAPANFEMDSIVHEEALLRYTPEGERIFNVAIYNDGGVLNDQINAFTNCINIWEDINYRLIDSSTIINGGLSDYDMIIMAGGVAYEESKALGSEGKEEILKFVINGGGYLGVCAGAYMALASEQFAIPLVNARTVSRNWVRGFAMLDIELTDAGKELFGDLENIIIGYNNGPVIESYGDLFSRGFETLAYLREGVGMNEYEAQLMINTPAIVRSVKGDGRIVIMNIHPEKINKYYYFVKELIYWICKKEQK